MQHASGKRSFSLKRTVLVAEDEPVNRMMLGEILSSDYYVVYANDGAEALDLGGSKYGKERRGRR